MIQRRVFISGAVAVAAGAILPTGVLGEGKRRHRYAEKRTTLDCWWWKGDPSSTEVPVMLYARRETKARLGHVPGALGLWKYEAGEIPKGSFWRVPLSDATHVIWCSNKSYPRPTVVSGCFPIDKPELKEIPSSIVIGRYHLGPRGLTFRDEGGNGKLAFGIRLGDDDYVTAAIPVADVTEVMKGSLG